MPIMRSSVRGVACPKCGAQQGARCFGKFGGIRNANHGERVSEYKLREARLKYASKKGGAA